MPAPLITEVEAGLKSAACALLDEERTRHLNQLLRLLTSLRVDGADGGFNFELAAAHFADSNRLRRLQRSFEPLWSHPAVPKIAALLMFDVLLRPGRHQLMFPELISDEASAAAVSSWLLLLKGLNVLFWRDSNSGQDHFAPCFASLLAAVRDAHRLEAVPARLALDLHLLAMRFLLYYREPHELLQFLYDVAAFSSRNFATPAGTSADKQLLSFRPIYLGGDWLDDGAVMPHVAPAAILDGLDQQQLLRTLAVFLEENCRHMRLITREDTLIRMLTGLPALRGLAVDPFTANRLSNALYEFQTPGGPLYPTRTLRHVAQRVNDELFPSGRIIRRVMYLAFRLLHPVQWPSSFSHWLRTVGIPIASFRFRHVLLGVSASLLAIYFSIAAALRLPTAPLESWALPALGQLSIFDEADAAAAAAVAAVTAVESSSSSGAVGKAAPATVRDAVGMSPDTAAAGAHIIRPHVRSASSSTIASTSATTSSSTTPADAELRPRIVGSAADDDEEGIPEPFTDLLVFINESYSVQTLLYFGKSMITRGLEVCHIPLYAARMLLHLLLTAARIALLAITACCGVVGSGGARRRL